MVRLSAPKKKVINGKGKKKRKYEAKREEE